MQKRFIENISKLQNEEDTLDDWEVHEQELFYGDVKLRNLLCICTKPLGTGYPAVHRKNGNQIIVGGGCRTKFNNTYKKRESIKRDTIKKIERGIPIENHDLTFYVKDAIIEYVKTYGIKGYINLLNTYKVNSPIHDLLLEEFNYKIYECSCGRLSATITCPFCFEDKKTIHTFLTKFVESMILKYKKQEYKRKKEEAEAFKMQLDVEDIEFDWFEETYGVMKFGTIYF